LAPQASAEDAETIESPMDNDRGVETHGQTEAPPRGLHWLVSLARHGHTIRRTPHSTRSDNTHSHRVRSDIKGNGQIVVSPHGLDWLPTLRTDARGSDSGRTPRLDVADRLPC
jgi:hypothetical protein